MPPVSVVDGTMTWNLWTTTASTGNVNVNVTNPWIYWAGTTASTTTTVWLDWNGSVVAPIVGNQYGHRQPTPEEIEARRLESAERQRVVAAARTKARQLLREVLDREQRRELEKDGHFHVATRDGERVYRLRPGAPPERVKGEDGTRWSYCIHPRESFPAEDTVAALKLLIEADEDAFLRIANASSRGRIPVPA